MRDRLIELISQVQYMGGLECKLADYLLKNGVIVPPTKLGKIFFEPVSYRKEIDECRVSSITQKADGSFKIRLTNLREKWVFEITPDKIGKTVFLTREEAEKALKERREECQAP